MNISLKILIIIVVTLSCISSVMAHLDPSEKERLNKVNEQIRDMPKIQENVKVLGDLKWEQLQLKAKERFNIKPEKIIETRRWFDELNRAPNTQENKEELESCLFYMRSLQSSIADEEKKEIRNKEIKQMLLFFIVFVAFGFSINRYLLHW